MRTYPAHSDREKRADRLMTILFVALLVVLVLFVIAFRHPVEPQLWPTATAHISGTRIVAVAAEERRFQSGTILYRIEAHVTYQMNGKRVDRWVPASGMKRDKLYLESWLSHKKQDSCQVRWNPRNPDDVEAILIDNVTQNASH
jgi:hypothetical protein